MAQGGLTRVIIPRLGEQKSFTLGLLIYVIGFSLFAVASEGWMMYAVMMFFSVSGIAMPALQSIVARQVPANEQGELQGSLMSLGSVAAIIAALLFTCLFTMFTAVGAPVYFPGAAYLGASGLCALALCLDIAMRLRTKGLRVNRTK